MVKIVQHQNVIHVFRTRNKCLLLHFARRTHLFLVKRDVNAVIWKKKWITNTEAYCDFSCRVYYFFFLFSPVFKSIHFCFFIVLKFFFLIFDCLCICWVCVMRCLCVSSQSRWTIIVFRFFVFGLLLLFFFLREIFFFECYSKTKQRMSTDNQKIKLQMFEYI